MDREQEDEELASDQANPNPESKAEAENKKAIEAALKTKLSRKRTKTGCLTCRKRRIKCGEERPICKNCVKSRRHCEGYVQPLVFKEQPTHDYHHNLPGVGAHINFLANLTPGPITPVVMPPTTNDFPALNPLRPRPPQYASTFDEQRRQTAGFGSYVSQYPNALTGTAFADQRQDLRQPMMIPNQQSAFAIAPFQQPNLSNISPVEAMGFEQVTEAVPSSVQSISPDLSRAGSYHQFMHAQPGPSTVRLPFEYSHDVKDAAVTQTQSQMAMEEIGGGRSWLATNPNHLPNLYNIIPPSNQLSRAFSVSHPLTAHTQQQWMTGDRGFDPTGSIEYAQASNAGPQFQAFHPTTPAPFSRSAPTTPYGYEQESQVPLRMSPTYFLNSAAVEIQDDDYYDVTSQEEMDDDDKSASDGRAPDHQRTLSNLLAMTQITPPGSQMRRYDTFIYHGILSDYNPEWVANPLRNPATARVFAHFIAATGPMLSIYERHPKNSSVLLARESIPFSQQGLWTYTMPMAALHHQGLLHAMLALASLHIARLQGASSTPSMMHYAWSLKRISNYVRHSQKRPKAATIAASMLLGFYDIMTADHIKWNMCLAGSKQLYIETDFVKMTQDFRRMKLDKAARDQSRGKYRIELANSPDQDELLDQMFDVDDSFVSRLAGREIRYGDHGSVEAYRQEIPQELNLSEYASLRDLYWWYCKQDVIQSILSGNPLLMDFSRWASCPPRAPLGLVDAVHGSFDHLILLLGRIADFASRDRVRKLGQMKANGDQWRPAPEMKMPGPARPQDIPMHIKDEANPTGAFLPIDSAAMPQFFGMLPQTTDNPRMPASYMPSQPTQPAEQDMKERVEMNLQVAMGAALEEYGQIRAALMTFSNSLGERFGPLTSEFQPTIRTPFGSALSYRSYDIGCLWAWYNMAVIIAIRSHPHMPPAAHVAAGIAAQDTAFFANEIGRISAGIAPGSPDEPLNPILGAALNESCLPSFFAGVQYHDHAQRHHTVTRIFDIARKTGWGSAELIANGCETAWVKTAEAGKGPPYERIVRAHSLKQDDPRINGSWEKLDHNAPPDGADELDRRLVRTNPKARLNWAIGVMGTHMDIG